MLILDGGLTEPRPLTAEERAARRSRLRVILGEPEPAWRERRLTKTERLCEGAAAMFAVWTHESSRIKRELRGILCAKWSGGMHDGAE